MLLWGRVCIAPNPSTQGIHFRIGGTADVCPRLAIQAQHMPYISALTSSSNRGWEETRGRNTTHLLLVRRNILYLFFSGDGWLMKDGIPATAGACATIASDALMNPFDGKCYRLSLLHESYLLRGSRAVVKQRMQVHGSTYESISECARTVYRTEGLRAFYISYPTTLAMTIPFTAIQFTCYESLAKVMNPKKRYDPLTHCVSGGLAGAAAAAITTPLDVIKTLLQTRGTSHDSRIRNCRLLDPSGNESTNDY